LKYVFHFSFISEDKSVKLWDLRDSSKPTLLHSESSLFGRKRNFIHFDYF
jgi:hypothetical protein